MIFQQIPNIPALFIKKHRLLVVADLHIGIEHELRKYGVHIDFSRTSIDMMLIDLCKKYKPNEIILLGDVKHSIPSTPFLEKQYLNDFLKHIQEIAPVHIIPGNHDGGIKQMIPQNIIIHKSDGYKKNDFGFIHGHRWPNEQIMQSKFLFCGHTHPTIKLTDRLGYHTYEPCWIKTSLNKKKADTHYQTYNKNIVLTIFPVFNPLCGGIAVNEEEIVGPIRHLVDKNKAEIYLLDGTFMGTLKQLQKP